MELVIRPTYITDLEKFEWKKKWRAVSITKEKRTRGEYYYAQVVRFFGEDTETDSYDVSTNSKDFAWIGRSTKAVGKMVFSKDPEKPGARIHEEPLWEEREDLMTKKKYKVLVRGTTQWNYTIPVTSENTQKMKSLVGNIGVNQTTLFKVIKGTSHPLSVEENEFFSTDVDSLMSSHFSVGAKKDKEESKPKKQ